jgi:hypothetical protein
MTGLREKLNTIAREGFVSKPEHFTQQDADELQRLRLETGPMVLVYEFTRFVLWPMMPGQQPLPLHRFLQPWTSDVVRMDQLRSLLLRLVHRSEPVRATMSRFLADPWSTNDTENLRRFLVKVEPLVPPGDVRGGFRYVQRQLKRPLPTVD